MRTRFHALFLFFVMIAAFAVSVFSGDLKEEQERTKDIRTVPQKESSPGEKIKKIVPDFKVLPDNVRVEKDIVFGKGGKKDLKLDLYLPANATEPQPGVICIHGGDWSHGSRARFRMWPVILAQYGYAAAAVDYRLSTEATFPAALEDVKCAVRWMRANSERHGIDPARIGALGTAGGGYLAAMLGVTGDIPEFEGSGGYEGVSSRLQSVISFYGPTDFTDRGASGTLTVSFPETETDYYFNYNSERGSPAVERFLGGAYQEIPEVYHRATALNYVTSDDPPILFVHGKSDMMVHYLDAVNLHKALIRANVHSPIMLLDEGRHMLDRDPEFHWLCALFVKNFFQLRLREMQR